MAITQFAIAISIKTGLEYAFSETVVPFDVIVKCIMSRLHHKQNEDNQRKLVLSIADEYAALSEEWSDTEKDEFMRLIGVALHDFYKVV